MQSIKPSYQKVALDPNFQVRAIFMHSTKGRDLFYCHWHPNIEIIHVTKGKISLSIDNQKHIFNEGDICILNPNQVHYGNAIEGHQSSVHLMVLSYDILSFAHDDRIYQKYIAPLKRGKYLLPTLLKAPEKSTPIFEKECYQLLLRLINYGDFPFNGREIAVQGTFLEFLALLYHNRMLVSSTNKVENKTSLRIIPILDFIEENFTRALSVQEIAEKFSINEDYFYRLFKESTGETPIRFIHNLRIRYAKQLLRNTDKSISEISFLVGFSSSSYFTKLFKRYADISPTTYRKNYMLNSEQH